MKTVASWLQRQPEDVRSTLFAATETRHVAAGEVIVGPDVAESGLFGTAHGRVALRLHRRGHSPRLVDLRRPGFWFGRSGLVRATPKNMEVVAHSAVHLRTVDAATVDALRRTDPRFLVAFADLVSAHAAVLVRHMEVAATMDPDARLARKIIGCVGAETGTMLEATQDELAEMTNASRNTVSRSLNRLAAQGAVRARYKHVLIEDGPSLARIAGWQAPVQAPESAVEREALSAAS